MKIVGISASPRKGQNCEKIIKYSLKFFEDKGYETESIKLSEVKVSPCVHCDGCKVKDHCVQDDVANSVNEKLAEADAIIVATPVYFGCMSGQLKCLLDKTLPLRRSGFKLKGKIGGVISVGAYRNGGQELVLKEVQTWMLPHSMIIVGDNNHFGGTVAAPFEKDDLGHKTVDGTLNAINEMLEKLK